MIMLENEILQCLINNVLHILNWIFTFLLFIGIGYTMEYFYNLYSINTIMAIPFTIMVLYLIAIPYNIIEMKIDECI